MSGDEFKLSEADREKALQAFASAYTHSEIYWTNRQRDEAYEDGIVVRCPYCYSTERLEA